MCIHATLYSFQNVLQHVAATNLDASLCQVLYQMKLLTTTLSSVVMLGRQLTRSQWLGILKQKKVSPKPPSVRAPPHLLREAAAKSEMARKSLEAQIQQSTSAKSPQAGDQADRSQVSWTLECDHQPRHQGSNHPNPWHWQLLHQRCYLEETLPAKSRRCHWHCQLCHCLFPQGPGLEECPRMWHAQVAQQGEGARTIHLDRCSKRNRRDPLCSSINIQCVKSHITSGTSSMLELLYLELVPSSDVAVGTFHAQEKLRQLTMRRIVGGVLVGLGFAGEEIDWSPPEWQGVFTPCLEVQRASEPRLAKTVHPRMNISGTGGHGVGRMTLPKARRHVHWKAVGRRGTTGKTAKVITSNMRA